MKQSDKCDFIYARDVKKCPVHEWVAAKILIWMGINVGKAKQYCGVSTCRAVLVCVLEDFKKDVDPTEFQDIQERQ